jgi:putative membrane protein
MSIMGLWLTDWYEWIRALHIIAVIAWMAGLLYLPRLFVYHVDAEPGSTQSETFKVMERRLIRIIINPAMVIASIFGVLLMFTPAVVDWSLGWVWIKLMALFGLFGLHGYLVRCCVVFGRDQNIYSGRFFRFINEIPTVLMIIIVIMAAVKPV